MCPTSSQEQNPISFFRFYTFIYLFIPGEFRTGVNIHLIKAVGYCMWSKQKKKEEEVEDRRKKGRKRGERVGWRGAVFKKCSLRHYGNKETKPRLSLAPPSLPCCQLLLFPILFAVFFKAHYSPVVCELTQNFIELIFAVS